MVAVDGPVLTISWDGQLADPNLPLPADFARIHVHLAQTPDMAGAPVRASIEARAGASTVTAVETAGTWWVALAVEAQSGRRSPLSAPVEAVVSLVDLDGALEAVRESADGKNTNHYSPVQPSPTDHELAEGDLWFDTSEDGQNLPHRWDGDSWVSVGDQRVEAVRSAMESMRGDLEGQIEGAAGNKITWSPAAPPSGAAPGKSGDTWFQIQSGRVTGQWAHDGSSWVSRPISHEVIASLDLGKATVGELDGARIKAGSVLADAVLVPGSAGSTVIADGAVTTEKLAAGAITAESGVIGSLDLGKATVGELDGARIKFGSAAGDILKADALDGKVITGAVVQTSHDHPKTLLDPAGVHVTDEDGQDIVYLGRQIGVRGPSGETLAQISDDGTISGNALNIEEDPVYAGLPLLGAYQAYERPSRDGYTGWLDSLPRGVVARGRLNPDINVNRGVRNGVIGLMELQFQQEAGRQFRITVEPITVFVFDGGTARLVVRYTWDGSQPNETSTNLADWRVRSTGGSPKYSLGGSFPYEGESTTTIRLLLCLETDKTVKLDDRSWSTRGRMLVEDIGPIVEDTTVDRLLKVENSVSTPEPPAPAKRNYTKRYWATAGRAYYTRGGYRTSNTDLVYQGDQPGMGGMRSALLFPSMTGDLSGAEITSMTMRIDFTHWYSSAGGDAQIQLHGLSSLPTSMPSMEHGWTEKKVPKPGQRVVKIPSQYWSRFKSGNVRGIGLGDTSPSTREYGYGRWARYYIEVKYRK
ncbi:hypothetical protein [Brevibacterium luteolum]|uniref:hypothetical protein n=1 Tax=Brevibacterium luteolum TaxID=199591 RepID=UPI0011AF09AF|nr:hypothetical protein [Brevibacterium luteolum]